MFDDLGWKDQIIQDDIVHGGQRTRARVLLVVPVTTVKLRHRQDALFADEHDVLSGEFFSSRNQAGMYLLEGLRNRHITKNRHLVVELHLINVGDVEAMQLRLQVNWQKGKQILTLIYPTHSRCSNHSLYGNTSATLLLVLVVLFAIQIGRGKKQKKEKKK